MLLNMLQISVDETQPNNIPILHKNKLPIGKTEEQTCFNFTLAKSNELLYNY